MKEKCLIIDLCAFLLLTAANIVAEKHAPSLLDSIVERHDVTGGIISVFISAPGKCNRNDNIYHLNEMIKIGKDSILISLTSNELFPEIENAAPIYNNHDTSCQELIIRQTYALNRFIEEEYKKYLTMIEYYETIIKKKSDRIKRYSRGELVWFMTRNNVEKKLSIDFNNCPFIESAGEDLGHYYSYYTTITYDCGTFEYEFTLSRVPRLIDMHEIKK